MKLKIGLTFVFFGIIGIIIFNNRNFQEQKESISKISNSTNLKKINKIIVKKNNKKKSPRKKILLKKRTLSGRKNRHTRIKNIYQSIGMLKKITMGNNQAYSFFLNRFASLSKMPGRKLITTYRSYFIYESSSEELENVFVNSKTNNIEIWTGEIIIRSEIDIRNLLSSYSNFEYKTQINDLHVVKVYERSGVFEFINEISKVDGIIKIELDLQKSRKDRI